MQIQNHSPTLQRIKQVIQRTGLPRSTLYYLMGKGEFPKPVKIAARAVAWDSEKVTAWIESRLQQTSPITTAWGNPYASR